MKSFDGKYQTSYLMVIAMFALSLTVCEIATTQEKCQNIDLENKYRGQEVEDGDLRQSAGNIQFHIGDFFQNFSYIGTFFYAKINTLTLTHTHIQRETAAMTIGKICKVDLPKNMDRQFYRQLNVGTDTESVKVEP